MALKLSKPESSFLSGFPWPSGSFSSCSIRSRSFLRTRRSVIFSNCSSAVFAISTRHFMLYRVHGVLLQARQYHRFVRLSCHHEWPPSVQHLAKFRLFLAWLATLDASSPNPHAFVCRK